MWRSPESEGGVGRKYTPKELSALIYPVDHVLDILDHHSPEMALNEPILHKMDEDELIFGFYELFQALLTDLPVPKGEHPGYQEAMVAELLSQTYSLVETECEFEGDSDSGFDPFFGAARRAAWTSYLALCYHPESTENLIDDIDLDLSDPEVYLSSRLTREVWDAILQTGGIFDALLWDTDWRLEIMLDRPEQTTEEVRKLMGYDLDIIHRLAPTPTPEQHQSALDYLGELRRTIA